MMVQLPSVTIAIPTCNRLSLLRQTLDSALSQTYSNLQVIASDNASDDGTADFLASIREPRFQFVRQETNIGMLRNWNACLERATGEFFLLLSDDDYLDQSAIDKLVKTFISAQQPNRVGIAYCRTWEVDMAGTRQSLDPMPSPYEDATEFAIAYFHGSRKMHPCSTLLRTSDLREIGGYEQGAVVLAVDAIAWSRILMKRGMIAAIPEPLSNYRIHPGSETSSQRIDVWRNDIAALIKLWSDFVEEQSPGVQPRFKRAAEHYMSWELAAIINQSAKSFAAQLRALGLYYRCRNEFTGATGSLNLAGGLTKLFVPELLKRPLRKLRLQATQR